MTDAPIPAPRTRVVVIGEDDEPIAILLRESINDEPGYQAVVVSDGAMVLDTVRSVHADLLILDIMMPGLNGFEVYDRVREDPDVRHMPVLFISAAADQHAADFKQRRFPRDGNAGRVVSAVLQLAQAFDDDRHNAFFPDVSNNSAHST